MRHDKQLALRIADSLLTTLDELRRAEQDLPSRAEMVRRLIENAKPAKARKAR